MKPAFKIASLTGPIQSIFRIVIGFLFACHGVASLSLFHPAVIS
jgi:hypothetical protein